MRKNTPRIGGQTLTALEGANKGVPQGRVEGLDRLIWCMVEYGGLWCMIYDAPWFMVMHGALWCMVVYDGIWCAVVYSLWWAVLYGALWCMVVHVCCDVWCAVVYDGAWQYMVRCFVVVYGVA